MGQILSNRAKQASPAQSGFQKVGSSESQSLGLVSIPASAESQDAQIQAQPKATPSTK